MNQRSIDLTGVTVAITRAEHQSRALRDALEVTGAAVISAPAIGFERPIDPRALPAALTAALTEPVAVDQWIVFTSPNAVSFTFDAAEQLDVEADWSQVRLAAVGVATAASLAGVLRQPDFVGSSGTAAGLAEELGARADVGHVLFPCAADARPDFVDAMQALGHVVERIVVYQTRAQSLVPAVRAALVRADLVIVASPSAVEAVSAWELSKLPQPVCIGPVTAEAAARAGWVVAAIAETPSPDALVAACASVLGR